MASATLNLPSMKVIEARLSPLLSDFRDEIQSSRVSDAQAKYFPLVQNILQEIGILDEKALSGAELAAENVLLAAKDSIESLVGLPRGLPRATDIIPINGINPFHNALVEPTSIADVQQLVKGAVKDGKKVRVIGAAHSRPKEIIMDVIDPSKIVLVSLTKYRGVRIDKEKKLASVKAGTNLGCDPHNKDSTLENSLCVQLDEAGYMLPETGGTIHQAVGGFIATGSADAIYSVTLVNGKGDVHTYSRNDSDPSLFYATTASAGLCGIITDVAFTLMPKSDIKGGQTGYELSPGGKCPVDIFGESTTGQPDIPSFFLKPENEYCRMLWFPHPWLPPRLQIWSGKQVPVQTEHTPLDPIDSDTQCIASHLLKLIWTLKKYFPVIADEIYKFVANFLVPLGVTSDFVDTWYKLLPMDNGIIDEFMPVVFSELWVSCEDASKAARAFRKLNNDDPSSVGVLFTEIYSGKASPFWLSPSYGKDKIRLGANWFQYNLCNGKIDPSPYFQKYFDTLDKAGIHYTTHLGKYRPESHCKVDHLKQDYPNYEKWLSVREDCDPNQIFLTKYWAHQLQIKEKRFTKE